MQCITKEMYKGSANVFGNMMTDQRTNSIILEHRAPGSTAAAEFIC